MIAQEYKDFPTTSVVISATIKTECIEHYNSIQLDVLLETLRHELWVAEQKLEEMYYRRGVSY